MPRTLGSVSPSFGLGWFWGGLTSLAALSAICFLAARGLAGPLSLVCDASRRIASGELEVRVSDQRLLARHDEFADLAHDFNAMAGRIEQLVASKQQLLWDISHELRSPLTRLGLALSVARRKCSPEASPSLDRMQRESENLNRLIEQLLTLARISGGSGPALNEQIELGALVAEVAEDARFEASCFNRTLVLGECATVHVVGARALLRSAVENVVRNAIRFTAEGTAAVVTVTAARDRGEATIRVMDHGPGVPEEALNRLFDAFYRVPETKEKIAGSGLGLAITNQVVLAHGGWVRARNRTGPGLEVEIGLKSDSS